MNDIKIPFCRPFLDGREQVRAQETIAKGWITTGKVTEELEKKIADYTGAKYAIVVTSCTAALHLCLEYLKRKKQKKNLTAYVPSLTFAATATEVINSGGEVIFGDVYKDTMCLKEHTEFNYDVAIPVHLTGNKASLDYQNDIIEDSAHLIYKDQAKDSKNLICYSFYATKNLTMGEGGAIVTNDEHAAKWFKQARHHGISKGGWDRYKEMNKWQYDIEFIGWKYNPSDVLSAILLENFNKIDTIHISRQRIVDIYNKELGYQNKGLHLYPVLVKDRSEFINKMAKAGIQCSVHFLQLDKMTAFKNLINEKRVKLNPLPNTTFLSERLVSLPLFPSLTNDEINYICDTIFKTNLLIRN